MSYLCAFGKSDATGLINNIMEKVALRKGVKRALQDLAGEETYAKYIESLRVPDWVLLFFKTCGRISQGIVLRQRGQESFDAREFRQPKITSSGANYSNLLNIQIATSKENTTAAKTKATTQPSTSKFLKSKLQIAHLNVRSVKERNHLIQLRELMCEKNYDVLVISESWLNSTTTDAEVEIAGYKITRLDRTKKIGGGVCIYTRLSLKIKRLKEMSVTSETGFQQLWVQIQLEKLRSIVLCVAYRPEYCPVSCFVDNFMDKYSQALTFGKNIIIAAEL